MKKLGVFKKKAAENFKILGGNFAREADYSFTAPLVRPATISFCART